MKLNLAGVIVLYNPNEAVLTSINSYINEINKLYVVDNSENVNVKVIEEEILKKDLEANYIIKIPSPLGNLMYFCKASKKKSCNEKDISSALIEGQIKKLPVIFLHNNLTKKAEELKSADAFKTMLFYSLKT